MDSIPVNWEALDALVIDFAKSENLIEDSVSSSPPSSSPSSSSYQSRLVIRQIKRSLEAGEIDSAMDLIHLHAPFILDDRRLLFRLQKQKFIELLRKGTAEDRDSAINCLRNALAPCALDAYPEAYEEFKHVLLAFIYDKDDHTSPVANEWSERKRSDIAGLMSSVLRAHLHAYDPVFSLTLRYLISIHKRFCLRQGISSPISNLTERLLLEERDHPAPPQSSYEAPPFDEEDIQALVSAVDLDRQGAVDGLRFAKGDLVLAFQNELSRMRLDVSMLDELIHEYCIYRGIVDSVHVLHPASKMQATSEPLKSNQLEPRFSLSRNCSPEVDYGSSIQSDGGTSINNTQIGCSSEINADVVSLQNTDSEDRYPSEAIRSHDDCSTSGPHKPEKSKALQRHRSHVIGERSKRKRWKGRHEKLECISEVLSGSTKQEPTTSKEQQATEKSSMVDLRSNKEEDEYEIVLGMKEMANRGMAGEVVEEINSINPSFFAQNPILLFQLKQVEFLKLVRSGDHASALKVASSYLGPLAANDPALLKPLKETLLALLRSNEEALGEYLPLHALATSLQVAIGRNLGIKEPQLMKIMTAILYSHTEWFKIQWCKDRFEGFLRIDSLKEVSRPMLTLSAASKSNMDTCSHGSSQVTISSSSRLPDDGSSPASVSSRDVIGDESSILKVMEFLALPRPDAIHLLSQYNWNAETLIQQLFT